MRSRTACYCLHTFRFTIVVSFLLAITSDALPVENEKNIRLPEKTELMEEVLTDRSKDSEKDSSVRTKRTVGFLRQLFPGLSQIIDRKIQQITRVIFRVVGRLILRGGGAGGGNAMAGAGGGDSGGGGGGGRISITLPTYPPFDDEDEEEASSDSGIPAQTNSPDSGKDDSDSVISSSEQPTTRSTLSDIDSNQVPESGDSVGKRVNRDVTDVLSDANPDPLPSTDEPEEVKANETPRKGPIRTFISRMREMRNKRNSFAFGSPNGGSGNFLFDVVRLVAGSGASPDKDEDSSSARDPRQGSLSASTSNNSSDSGSNISGNSLDTVDDANVAGSSEDTYDAAIPGPLTRLFILVNRGISNMVQDLILRLAQTSERLINFKARLVTSII